MKNQGRKCDDAYILKAQIRHLTNNAVKSGKVEVKPYCENCKSTKKKLIKHHPDPCNPFKIITLCQSCHALLHRNIGVFNAIASGDQTSIIPLSIPVPLPVSVPSSYATILNCKGSHISHCNAGRRRFTIPQFNRLMEASLTDPRLAGLTFLQLHPELEESQRWLADAQPEGQPDEQ